MVTRIVLVLASLMCWECFVTAQSIPLTDLEVSLSRIPHGGCFGPCVQYTITVRGDGSVGYSGTGLVEGTRKRTVSPDEVVSLVNEFLKARFFDALDIYGDTSSIERQGETVVWRGSASADNPQVDLTLRVGDRRKTVTLYHDYPAELGRLSELVESIGGPRVWQARVQ